MSTNINFVNSLGSENDTRVDFNLPRTILLKCEGRAVASSLGVAEAELCSYNTLNGLNYLALLRSASLIVTPNSYNEGTLFSVIPSNGNGDFTVTRATKARRTNSSGLIESVANNVPRLDYSLGSCPNLLLEPQRTNVALRSEEFDISPWGTLGTVTITPNATTSPSGTLTADLILGADSGSSVNQIISGTIGFVYTNSFYIKNNNSTQSRLAIRNSITAVECNINWSGNTLSGITNLTGVTTFQDVGDGWYRIISTYTALEANQRPRVLPSILTANQSVYLWGAQLEAGNYSTSYIPTTSASVTRNADVISKTGISSLIGQTEGTLYAEVIIKNTENQICASIQRDGGFNHIFISQFNNKRQFSVRANNVTIFNYNVGVFLSGINKVAIVYNTNGDIRAYLNGANVSTLSTSAFAFSNTLDSLQIFDDGYYSSQNTTNNKSTILFKTALTNAQAISLTTL
jgi:hypothetical protein